MNSDLLIKNKLPNFLVVGAPKAGTTSLYEYLSQHPQVFLTEEKELHFWSNEELAKSVDGPGDALALSEVVESIDDYRAKFSGVTNELAVGDISPSYLYFSEPVIEKLKKYYSGNELKIIILLREPSERAYSQYLHQKRLMLETVSFEEAVEIESERRLSGYGDFWRYVDHSIYSRRCSQYIDAFGKANVKIFLFEELRDNPQKVVQDVFAFLGVDEDFKPDNLGDTFNKGGVYGNNVLTRFLLKPSKFKQFVFQLVGDSLLNKYRLLKGSVLDKYTQSKPKISVSARESMAHSFEQDKIELAKIIGDDLTKWDHFNEER